MLRLKKKDMVMVLAGKDKGKRGELHKILVSKNKFKVKVLVTGINTVVKHKKPSHSNPGGIQKIESPLDISNVALVCPKCDKAVKVKVKRLENKDKIRLCKKCGKEII